MVNKRKIGIATWTTYQNYGTFLQAFALKKALLMLGFEQVDLLDDSNVIRSLTVQNITFAQFLNKLKKCFIRLFLPLFKKAVSQTQPLVFALPLQQLRKEKFESFRRSQLVPVSLRNTRDYQAFIAGSDQIWRPEKGIFSPWFYLNFADGSQQLKFSYASSLCVTGRYPKQYAKQVKKLLIDFSAVSVREQEGGEALQRILPDKKVEVMPDPVLLLNAQDWVREFQLKNHAQKGIFAYMLDRNSKYETRIQEISKELSLPVYWALPQIVPGDEKKNIATCGPIEFLQEIFSAKLVLTDSFHATLFSLIFHTSFYTFQRFVNTSSKSQNNRLEFLLGKLNLMNRFLNESSTELNCAPIGFAEIDKFLKKQQETGTSYLKKQLY